jgi:hypothetical protein
MIPERAMVQSMRRLLSGPDWSSWVLILVVVLLVCGLVVYWLSNATV